MTQYREWRDRPTGVAPEVGGIDRSAGREVIESLLTGNSDSEATEVLPTVDG